MAQGGLAKLAEVGNLLQNLSEVQSHETPHVDVATVSLDDYQCQVIGSENPVLLDTWISIRETAAPSLASNPRFCFSQNHCLHRMTAER